MSSTKTYALDPTKLPPQASCHDGLKQGDVIYQGQNAHGNYFCRHEPIDGRPAWYHYYNMTKAGYVR